MLFLILDRLSYYICRKEPVNFVIFTHKTIYYLHTVELLSINFKNKF